MKRMLYILCLFLVLSACFVLPASAWSEEDMTEDIDKFLTQFEEQLPQGYAPELDTDSLMAAVSVEGILAMVIDALRGAGTSLLTLPALLLGACCLMSVVPDGDSTPAPVVRAAIGAVFAVSVYEQLHTAVRAVIDGIGAASSFFSSLTPLLAAVTLAGGAEATGAVQAVGMGMTAQALQLCAAQLLTPLTSLLFALGLIGTLGDEGGAQRLTVRVKHVFLWITGIASTLLAATLGLQTVLASSADGVAMRTVKYTVSGSLPIVGGTVSGALSTLATGLAYVKSTMGMGTVAVLLWLLLPPLVILAVYRIGIGIGVFVWQLVCPDRPCYLLTAFSGALDTTLAVGCLSGVLLILECVFFMKGGMALLS